jgi:hypothetical protein
LCYGLLLLGKIDLCSIQRDFICAAVFSALFAIRSVLRGFSKWFFYRLIGAARVLVIGGPDFFRRQDNSALFRGG